MPEKLDVKQGTLALMILKTVEVLGPLHGYGIARRIEETSRNRLSLNYGTLYPALLKLEQERNNSHAKRANGTRRPISSPRSLRRNGRYHERHSQHVRQDRWHFHQESR